jgi:hypothetical protein
VHLRSEKRVSLFKIFTKKHKFNWSKIIIFF